MKKNTLCCWLFVFAAFVLGGCDLYPKIMNIGGTSTGAPNELYASNPDVTYGRNNANGLSGEYGSADGVNIYGNASAPDVQYASSTDYSTAKAKSVVDNKIQPQIVVKSNDAVATTPGTEYLAYEAEPDDILLVPEKVASAPQKVTVIEPSAGTVTVKKGDTVFAISQRYDVSLRDLLEENKLVAPYAINVGQKLKLPASRYHVVKSGETLYSISRSYSVDLNSLVKENDLKEPYGLAVGQKLRLPGTVTTTDVPVQVVVTPQTATTKTTSVAAQATQTKPVSSTPSVPDKTKVSSTTASGAVAKLPSATARASTKFSWPVQGKILSSFGAKNNGLYNDGINIGAKSGTTVKAAENGVVAYAGNELKGMGNLVIVQHSGGWMTVYAHMDTMVVKRGLSVSVGQKIGTVGKTGKVSEPQLHFEIRKGTKAYNPTSQLKK